MLDGEDFILLSECWFKALFSNLNSSDLFHTKKKERNKKTNEWYEIFLKANALSFDELQCAFLYQEKVESFRLADRDLGTPCPSASGSARPRHDPKRESRNPLNWLIKSQWLALSELQVYQKIWGSLWWKPTQLSLLRFIWGKSGRAQFFPPHSLLFNKLLEGMNFAEKVECLSKALHFSQHMASPVSAPQDQWWHNTKVKYVYIFVEIQSKKSFSFQYQCKRPESW